MFLFSGCSSSDQTVDPGNNQNPATDGGADGSGVTIQVSYQSQAVPVDLGAIATSTWKGVNLVKLSDVWTSSQIASDRATLEFEFVADDGFKPSNKGCADLPGDALDRGYIDPASRNLIWDESLGFKGCYSVKNAAQMNAHAPTGGSDAAAE
jgi:hypothetical protein